MTGSTFYPGGHTITVGGTIRWTNMDAILHTTTSDSSLWDSGSLARNNIFEYTFNTPGTYPFHCSIHPGMTGVITVVTNCVVTALFVGRVNWQGPPAQPNSMQMLPLTLTLKLGTYEYSNSRPVTDARGYFTITINSVPAGTYGWRVKGPKYLANSGVVALPGSSVTTVDMGVLRAGDANNDNLVTILDFNILKATFGRGQGDPGYDDRADFTGDRTVTVTDFNLVKGNFGSGGSPPLGPWE